MCLQTWEGRSGARRDADLVEQPRISALSSSYQLSEPRAHGHCVENLNYHPALIFALSHMAATSVPVLLAASQARQKALFDPLVFDEP